MTTPARYHPDPAAFLAACAAPVRPTLVPIYREVVVDGDTPVSAFHKLVRQPSGGSQRALPYAFLLESVVGGAKWAAYSFIGLAPRAVLRVADGQATVTTFDLEGHGEPHQERFATRDPADALARFVVPWRTSPTPGLPRFFGGAVGYLGYDAVRAWEPIPTHAANDLGLPDAVFLLSDVVVIFDNLRQTVKVVATAHVPDGADPARCQAAWASTCRRIDAVVEALRAPPAAPLAALDLDAPERHEPRSRTPAADFLDGVRRIKEHILAGDAFQIVLSQRFEADRAGADPFDVYRALRVLNPSPYMFHIQLPEAAITGASPETLVRLEGRRVEVRPIAGTRRRGRDADEDAHLEAELRADEKERAEHVMLIDLGRNDVGRVARIGSVRVEQTMAVERYSHVMHLVSLVSGELADDKTALDVLRACFPAGTLSGAPKVRAMQIIEELEPVRRGIYGGAVGYLGFPDLDGRSNLDLAIAIRTLVTVGERVYVQAGAGVVHDSVPEAELEETRSKARAVVRALDLAAAIAALRASPDEPGPP